ncbi:hypothetical protein [Piscibacillus salipiscarius]|uniref:hypothetical protein n=1 Tax=Piscibacillus salipiscarius TaxID=299480 RepID=UPI002436BA16|nr:hypothetical protein [Piscibacillus salipiscarius]
MDRSELAKGRRLLMQQGYLLIPIFVLLYFLVIERVSVNNSAFYSITILLVIALFAHRFKESMGRSLVFAAILLGIAYTFHYVVKLLNLGLYNLNDLFGTSFFSSETIRWKDQIAPMVLIGILVALFCAWSEKIQG